jgi:hypothetical protein
MSYTPSNICVYLKAFAGTMAGLAASGKYLNDPSQGDYQIYAQMADAFSQQFDSTWGLGAVTAFEEDLISENCEAVWENRSPLKTPDALIPANYTGLVNGVIAAVQQANAQVVLEGVNPNGCGAAARGTLSAIQTDATTLTQLTVPFSPGISGKMLLVGDFTPASTGRVQVSWSFSIDTNAHDIVQLTLREHLGLSAIVGGSPLTLGITQEPTSTTQTSINSGPSLTAITVAVPGGGGAEIATLTLTVVYTGLTPGQRYGFSVLGASGNNTTWQGINATFAATELPLLA